MPTNSSQFNAKFSRIPKAVQEELLELYQVLDVSGTKFTLAPHGKGTTWRLRWRTGRRQHSLSVGSDPKVLEAVGALLADWRAGQINFLLYMFRTREAIPNIYLAEMYAGSERRTRELERWQNRFIVRIPPEPKPGTAPLTAAEKEKFRQLPTPLFKRLVLLQKQVNVLSTNFNVSKRPDRNVWIMRWRECDNYGQIAHKSITLGTSDEAAQLVKDVIECWHNWQSPLLDILFPEQIVPPEYWGIDTFHRIVRTFPDSPMVNGMVKMPFRPKREMPDILRDAPGLDHPNVAGI